MAGTAARVALPSDPIFLSKLQRTNDKGEKKNKVDYLAQFSIGRKNTSTPRPGQGCVNVKRHNYAPTSVKLMTLKQHQMCPLNATQVDPSNDTPSDSQVTPVTSQLPPKCFFSFHFIVNEKGAELAFVRGRWQWTQNTEPLPVKEM